MAVIDFTRGKLSTKKKGSRIVPSVLQALYRYDAEVGK